MQYQLLGKCGRIVRTLDHIHGAEPAQPKGLYILRMLYMSEVTEM
jgi:hypothetical protein